MLSPPSTDQNRTSPTSLTYSVLKDSSNFHSLSASTWVLVNRGQATPDLFSTYVTQPDASLPGFSNHRKDSNVPTGSSGSLNNELQSHTRPLASAADDGVSFPTSESTPESGRWQASCERGTSETLLSTQSTPSDADRVTETSITNCSATSEAGLPPGSGSNVLREDLSQVLARGISRSSQVDLLQVYLMEPGPWIEALDSERHFTVKDVHHMMNCISWRAAALALSCRHKNLSNQSYPSRLSLELYQDAVKSMIGYRSRDDDSGVLASGVLLAVYEMMTAEYVDWWRHLEGCTGLFLSHGWNASTGGLVSSCFWAYVRSGKYSSSSIRAATDEHHRHLGCLLQRKDHSNQS